MTLKEDYTRSRETLAEFRTLTQLGGAKGSPEAQKRPLARLGRHPGPDFGAADKAGCVNLACWFFLAKKEAFQTPDL